MYLYTNHASHVLKILGARKTNQLWDPLMSWCATAQQAVNSMSKRCFRYRFM